MEKYSAKGPSASAGKNDSAAIMMITDSNTATNAGLCTFNVPALSGIYFLEARDPAIAIGPMIGMNLPKSIFFKSFEGKLSFMSLGPTFQIGTGFLWRSTTGFRPGCWTGRNHRSTVCILRSATASMIHTMEPSGYLIRLE